MDLRGEFIKKVERHHLECAKDIKRRSSARNQLVTDENAFKDLVIILLLLESGICVIGASGALTAG